MTDTLERIKQLYYKTSKTTILTDFDTAIDLLKSMGTEEERERATAYMEGLAQLRSQWASGAGKAGGAGRAGEAGGKRRTKRQ